MQRVNKAQVASIPLKRIHDDILKDNKSSTLTTKQMRVKLRAKMKASHDHNASWVFTQAQYDGVRAMFDPAYAKKIAKPAKAPRVRKQVETPVEA
jgi:hypothetical protein